MDELDLIRAARPRDDYPDSRRVATRALLLAEITKSPAPRPAGPGTRRSSWRWQAGMAAGLAIGVAAAGAAVLGTTTPAQTRASRPVPSGSLAHVLELAARTADQSAPPAGARWIVTEYRDISTGSSTPECAGTVKATSGPSYAKIFSVLASCPATPPAFLPGLRAIKTITVDGPGSLGPLAVPGPPGPLIAALNRWLNTGPRHALPGPPVPHVPAAGLHLAAFDALSLMIRDGVTTPSQVVLLRALGKIPGVKVIRFAHGPLGGPGIGVTISTATERGTIIMDAATYKIIGGSQTYVFPGGSATTTDTQLWQAYYDAAGHRL